MALTESQIFDKLDDLINASRGDDMFVEVEFSVDFVAETVLSFDEDNNEWIVNRFVVHSDDDTVEIEPMPIMSFARGML